jgi:hypothetical protein
MPIMSEGPLRAICAHDQADRGAGDHALQVAAPGGGSIALRCKDVDECGTSANPHY